MRLVAILVAGYVALSSSVRAEDRGVTGSWALPNSESECSQQAVFEIGFADNGSFYAKYYDGEDVVKIGAGSFATTVRRVIREAGTYAVVGDSIILLVVASGFADRVGMTFAGTFSRSSGYSLTLTNARVLTGGHVDAAQVVLYELALGASPCVNRPFVGAWALYDPAEIEHEMLFEMGLASNGLFLAFWQDHRFVKERGAVGVIHERGTYVVSGDLMTITITESELPDRIGLSFTVSFSMEGPDIVLTNASLLTAGYIKEETVALTVGISSEGGRTAVRPDTWGKIKSGNGRSHTF